MAVRILLPAPRWSRHLDSVGSKWFTPTTGHREDAQFDQLGEDERGRKQLIRKQRVRLARCASCRYRVAHLGPPTLPS